MTADLVTSSGPPDQLGRHGPHGPGRLPHGLEAGGQAARGGALLHPVQPDPVRGELLAGHHARLGVHLLAAQGDAHRVVDGQDESFVSLSPCNETRVRTKRGLNPGEIYSI